jgi:hypothetical protein
MRDGKQIAMTALPDGRKRKFKKAGVLRLPVERISNTTCGGMPPSSHCLYEPL